MNKLNILVFPAGSEIGLEICRSLKDSNHFCLFGGSSVDDHGKFVFSNYIENIPSVFDEHFIDVLNRIIIKYKIDILYPTMDSVIDKVSRHREKLNCLIATSPKETTMICLSKKKTYEFLKDYLPIPKIFETTERIEAFPVFLKPDIGYSAKGTLIADNINQIRNHLIKHPDSVILEYLPGDEYTIDCFTDKNRQLRFSGARKRQRIINGISVNTSEANEEINKELKLWAIEINKLIELRGAWFFQVKLDVSGKFKLLEVACRLAGSSALFRNKGINFALLTIWDLLNKEIQIIINDYKIELDRALENKYKILFRFTTVFLDFDDCLIIQNKVNQKLICFIYKSLNEGKRIILITKHRGDLQACLVKYRLNGLFDKILQIDEMQNKSDFIWEKSAIFIDDSFSERLHVHKTIGIPVFSPDMIESLL